LKVRLEDSGGKKKKAPGYVKYPAIVLDRTSEQGGRAGAVFAKKTLPDEEHKIFRARLEMKSAPRVKEAAGGFLRQKSISGPRYQTL